MSRSVATALPTLLFGAFDRHNFGDLLFPHIAAVLLEGDELLFAGLLARDLRCYGGHQVAGIASLAAEWGERPLRILHVGGELLSCDAWQAAVMLLPPERAQEVIAHLDALPQQRLAWAHDMLGLDALAPYTLSRQLFPAAVDVIYNAVGGVHLNASDSALRNEVLMKLSAADLVTVRDRVTRAQLAAAGISAKVIPDPAVMVAELFGEKILDCARQDELAHILRVFPQGYIAVQFSAEFGDDETLATIAAQLDQMVGSSGYGVVLFRAGAAPWHDDLECYQRLAARMRSGAVKIFSSLNIWQICAVIAHSRAYCGSSLHGRIVAMAFALPRLNLRSPSQAVCPTKQEAYASTWDVVPMPTVVAVHEIAVALADALAIDSQQLQGKAVELASRYRMAFAQGWGDATSPAQG